MAFYNQVLSESPAPCTKCCTAFWALAVRPGLLGCLRMLDTNHTIVCLEPLVWLFSPAWNAVILTLDVGFICLFVVIDSTV